MSSSSQAPVLIIDAEERSALACIRSLGQKKVPVVLASHVPHAPGFYSRYARNRPICSYFNPNENPGKYVDDVMDICRAHNICMILPQSERSLVPLLESRDKWPAHLKIPVAENRTFFELQDKLKAARLMDRFDLSVPTIWTPSTIHEHLEEVSFPCLMKPRRSIRTAENSLLENLKMKWIVDKVELMRELQDQNIDQYYIQEYKKGYGGAICLLMWEGQCLARLDQITLRQQAGPGSVTKAISGNDIYPEIAEKAQNALNSVGWNGVIMVELRTDPDTNTTYFIECNPRFWGPTQLALDSGVDFPYLLFRAASNQKNNEIPKVVATGYTWHIGHWYSSFFAHIGRPSDFFAPKVHNRAPNYHINNFKDLFFRWDDLVPALYEIKRLLFLDAGKRVLNKLSSIWSRIGS